MSGGKLLVYLLRRDLRVADNPILHHLATTPNHGFSHLLPIFIFPCHQIEVSGFLKHGETSPYPKAVSQVGKFLRCGPHRAKFTAEAVWDLKNNFEDLNSGLVVRVGSTEDVLKHLFRGLKDKGRDVGAVWMTEELAWEEVKEQEAVASACAEYGTDFKLWADEKYFIDDRDTNLAEPSSLPDVFTSYRKSQEPLRQRPRPSMPRPKRSSLPAFPEDAFIPAQHHPFMMENTLQGLTDRLLKPMGDILANPPSFPNGAITAHPFHGGENPGHERIQYLIKTGGMTTYKDTRNNLLGPDYSTKLSGYLALGCISARQIHSELLSFEDGNKDLYAQADGYGKGENEGTKSIRFELLWRDYMRLCTGKFGRKLFEPMGFRQDEGYSKEWKTSNRKVASANQQPSPDQIAQIIQRFLEGTTGMGLIDASQRELYLTGYTSNRARQNVASFFAKHLEIDWRYGAEWYESMLIDYDVHSNWANWQYVAGVGNDPRGDARVFNPVKQGFDYDKEGAYVRTWVPELKNIKKMENIFQIWTTSEEELKDNDLLDNIMVTDPLKRIEFTIEHRPKPHRSSVSRWRGSGRGGHGGRGGGNGGGNGGNSGHGGHGGAGGGGGRGGGDGNRSKFVPSPNASHRGNSRGAGGGGGTGHRGYHNAPRGSPNFQHNGYRSPPQQPNHQAATHQVPYHASHQPNHQIHHQISSPTSNGFMARGQFSNTHAMHTNGYGQWRPHGDGGMRGRGGGALYRAGGGRGYTTRGYDMRGYDTRGPYMADGFFSGGQQFGHMMPMHQFTRPHPHHMGAGGAY